MADDNAIDSLIIDARFNVAGLDQSETQVLRALRSMTQAVTQASGSLPPLDINTSKLVASLKAAGTSVSEFFGGLRQNIASELQAATAAGAAGDEIAAIAAKVGPAIDQMEKLATAAEGSAVALARVGAEGARFDAVVGRFRLPDTGQFVSSARVAADQTALLATQLVGTGRAAETSAPRIDAVSAAMGRATAGANAWGQGMARLASQQTSSIAALERQASAARGFAEAGRQANLDPFQRGLENIRLTGAGTRIELDAGGRALGRHAQAAKTAASSLGILAASSVGAEGPLGRLAQTALFVSGGLGAVAAGAIGVLALSAAYNFLTTAQREAASAQQKLLDGLLEESRRMSDAERAAKGLAAAEEALRRSREGLTAEQVGKALIPAAQLIVSPGAALAQESFRQQGQDQLNALRAIRQARQDLGDAEVTTLTRSLQLGIATGGQQQRAIELVRILESQQGTLVVKQERQLVIAEQLRDLQAALVEGKRQEAAISAFQASAEQARLTALSAAPGLGTDTPASIRERATEMARLTGIINSSTASLTERNAAAEQFNALVAGVQVPLERQRQAALQIAEAQASAYHDVAEAFADALGVVQAAIGALGENQFTKIIEAQRSALKSPDVGNIALPDTGISGGFERAADSVDEVTRALEEAAAAADKFFRKANAAAGGVTEAARKAKQAHIDLNNAIHDVTQGLDSLVGAAVNIGLLGESAAAQIGSFLDLADAIGSVIEKASTGNILGLAGAGINLIATIAGGSAESQARDRILEENNRRLTELKLSLDRSLIGASAAQNAQTAAAAAAANTAITQVRSKGENPTVILAEQLAAAGLTVEEFAKIVKDTTGLEILDDKGRIIGKTLAQADEALKAYIKDITTLSAATSDHRRQLEIEDDLGIGGRSTNPEVAALERERQIQLENLQLDPATEARIRGLDLNTEEGRAAFLAFEQGLYKAARAGEVTAEQLGGFTDVDELVDSVGTAAEGLNALTEATDAASKSMLNIPSGFKLNRLAFLASDAGPALAPVTRLPVPPPSIDPGSLRPRGGDGASLPGFSVTFASGSIVQRPDEDSEAFARRVVEVLRQTALRQGGDTLQVGTVT